MKTIQEHEKPFIDHLSQRKHGISTFPERLHVVTAISNPERFRSRYDLYRRFEKQIADGGGVLYTIELAFGHRPFEITHHENPRHIQLRSFHQLWHKENLLNLAVQRLPADWKYVAWVDADLHFARPDWCQETIHQLQHFHVVQMFSHALDVGPNFEPINANSFKSFMYLYHRSLANGMTPKMHDYDYDGSHGAIRWHSGYCWATHRGAFNNLGGLIDFAVLGSADRHMAAALIGQAQRTLHHKLHPRYKEWVMLWQQRAEKYIQRNVGYVDGLIYHYWHGKKADRRYSDRWNILIRNQFDPLLDLKRDQFGLWQLTDRNFRLRDDLRAYFRARNEDSIDIS